MDSMYEETERELSMKNMSNYGLNPAATKALVEDYKKKCAPYPIQLFISVGNSPIVRLSEVCGDIEIYLSTPGYVGKAGKGKVIIDTMTDFYQTDMGIPMHAIEMKVG